MLQLSDFNLRLMLVIRPCYNPGRWVRSCLKKHQQLNCQSRLADIWSSQPINEMEKNSNVTLFDLYPVIFTASASYCDFYPKRFLFGVVATHQGSPLLIKANRWSFSYSKDELCAGTTDLLHVWKGAAGWLPELPIPWEAPLSLLGSCAVLTDTGWDWDSKSKQWGEERKRSLVTVVIDFYYAVQLAYLPLRWMSSRLMMRKTDCVEVLLRGRTSFSAQVLVQFLCNLIITHSVQAEGERGRTLAGALNLFVWHSLFGLTTAVSEVSFIQMGFWTNSC